MTSDLERELVLQQNEMLRGYSASNPQLFQRLRRCCICLQSSCSDLSACRAAFSAWAEKRWDTAVKLELGTRGSAGEMRSALCEVPTSLLT